ncbi:hypothetical protein D2Q93_12925 [Alicyclobacillaceae bacterium I2511]|nr:hypothetical protein D2Q93_12925 [Alicyclobacillaceae bacterium I2511]
MMAGIHPKKNEAMTQKGTLRLCRLASLAVTIIGSNQKMSHSRMKKNDINEHAPFLLLHKDIQGACP